MKNFCIFIFAALFCLSCATDSFGVYHTVKKGEKVSEISKLYKADEALIREENSIPEGVDELREGSAIFIPGAEKVLESEPAPEAQAPESNEEKEKETANEEKPEIIPSEDPEPEDGININLIWPATGKIVRPFSVSAPKSDGIDIEFEKGTEIHAAADGKVIYSASHSQFGNMVIIRHDNNFITIYAYLHTLFAKEGMTIKQNSVLGIADANEKKSVPTLHFEVRKAAKPIDPMKFLPEN